MSEGPCACHVVPLVPCPQPSHPFLTTNMSKVFTNTFLHSHLSSVVTPCHHEENGAQRNRWFPCRRLLPEGLELGAQSWALQPQWFLGTESHFL